MPDLNDVQRMLDDEQGFAVISTTQKDGRVLSTVANCGVTEHPITGEASMALVSAGGAARLTHIRRGSAVTVMVRRGGSWLAVTGAADIIGPDDPVDGIDTDALRLLLRSVYNAAGGTTDDYDEFDRVMADERRPAIFVAPERILGWG